MRIPIKAEDQKTKVISNASLTFKEFKKAP
jgi:hypothetical protein